MGYSAAACCCGGGTGKPVCDDCAAFCACPATAYVLEWAGLVLEETLPCPLVPGDEFTVRSTFTLTATLTKNTYFDGCEWALASSSDAVIDWTCNVWTSCPEGGSNPCEGLTYTGSEPFGSEVTISCRGDVPTSPTFTKLFFNFTNGAGAKGCMFSAVLTVHGFPTVQVAPGAFIVEPFVLPYIGPDCCLESVDWAAVRDAILEPFYVAGRVVDPGTLSIA